MSTATAPIDHVRRNQADAYAAQHEARQAELAKAHLRKLTTAKQIERLLADVRKYGAAREYPAPFTIVSVGHNHVTQTEVSVRPNWYSIRPVKKEHQEIEVLYEETVGIVIVQLEGIRFEVSDSTRWIYYSSSEPLLFIDDAGVLHDCPRLSKGTAGFAYSICPLVFDEKTLRKWSEEKLSNLLELLRSIIQQLNG